MTDLRFAFRQLLKHPGFTFTAVLALALGVGATTAIFGVIYAFLLRPLPFAEPAQLVMLQSHNTQSGSDLGVNYLDYLDWQTQARSFSEMAFFNLRWNGNLQADASATETLKTTFTTANLFSLLGVEPSLGRNLTAADDAPDAPAVMLISHRLWWSAFGGERGIVGREISLDGEKRTVLGVMPPGFRFPSQSDIWIPAAQFFGKIGGRSWRADQAIGRLKPGVSVAAAEAEVKLIAERLAAAHPDTNRDIGATVLPLREHWVGNVRGSLVLLLAACGALLLIACANVGQLMLARASGRSAELLVRSALGASRARLVRQLLTESALLGLLGSGVGILLSYWLIDLVVALIPIELPFWIRIEVNPVVLAGAVAISCLTGLLAGSWPAWHATRVDVAQSLKSSGAGTTGNTRSMRGGILTVAQVAVSVVLLVGAGLLVRTIVKLGEVNPGFDAKQVLLFEVNPTYRSEESAQTRIDRFARLLEGLQQMPGVAAVASNNSPPFYPQRPWNRAEIAAEGQSEEAQARNPQANFQTVSADYFTLLHIPLVRGRAFDQRDALSAPPVCVVSESLARRLWPNEDALGRKLLLGKPATEAERLTVVGVVGDVRHQALNAASGPEIYKPTTQLAWKQTHFLVRAGDGIDPLSLVPAIRREVAARAPGVGVYNFVALEKEVADSLWQPRLRTWLVSFFALVALLLTATGLHGVLAVAVTQRTREIGVRMALGATRGGVLGLVVRQGMRAVVAGVALGLVAAFGLARLLQASLFGISGGDFFSFATAGLFLLLVAGLACFFPARRAARMNPMEALRHE